MTDYSDVARMYNESAQNWDRDKPTYWSDFDARPKLVELATKLQPKNILDIGCGEGYVSRKVAIGARITGIDISEELIKIARRKEQEKPLGITYHIGDMTELSRFQETFDMMTSAFATQYTSLEDHAKLFKQAARIVKGHAVIATLDPESYWRWLNENNRATTYEQDEGKIFKIQMPGKNGTTEVWYVHRTRERMEKDFTPFKIQERILIPSRQAKFDYVVYQLTT